MATLRSGLHDSSGYIGDPKALQAAVDRDSYLFFKGLLPRDAVLSLQDDILSICERHGWVDTTAGEPGMADTAAANAMDSAVACRRKHTRRYSASSRFTGSPSILPCSRYTAHCSARRFSSTPAISRGS